MERFDEHTRECPDCEGFFAAIDRGDKQGLLALSAGDIEWIIPVEDWPLAGTHRGHAGLADVLQKASEEVEMTYPVPPEFVAQGDRVMVVGVAFPTLYFYETGYSLHTLRQASRRSWRIGQRHPVHVKFLVTNGTTQTTCLRLMGKKMLVALMMEGKFSGEGIHSLESDDDMMSAMARELVERGRVGESADAVWADLKRERAQHMPPMPRVSQTDLVAEDHPLLPLLSQMPIAPSSPALHLVEPNPKTQQKPSTLWPTGNTEGEQMLLFA